MRLFDRSVRPPALLPSGELLAREGRVLLSRWEDVAARVQLLETRDGADLEGRVTVVAIYSAGIGLLKSVKDHFEQRWPGVHVSLSYMRPEQIAEAIRRGQFDVGITSYPRQWREVRHRPLRDERMVAVCAAEHPLADRDEVRAAELASFQLAGFETSLPVSRAIRRYLKDNGVRPEFANLVDNIDTMKSLLAATDLVALLPERTVLGEVASGSLATVTISPALARPMGVVSSRESDLSRAAATFVEFLVEHAGPRDAAGQPVPEVGTSKSSQVA